MLVRANILTKDQLEQALRAAQTSRNLLHEELLALGYVTERGLVDFFRGQLMIPEIRAEDMELISPEIRDLVPPEMAHRFHVAPVRLDAKGHLILAMANPADAHAADELVHHTDLYVVRTVAEASVVREVIERLYGPSRDRERSPETTPGPPPPVGSGIAPPPKAPGAPGAPKASEADGQPVRDDVVLLTKVKRPKPKRRPQSLTGDASRDASTTVDDAEEPVIALTRVKRKPGEQRKKTRTLSGQPLATSSAVEGRVVRHPKKEAETARSQRSAQPSPAQPSTAQPSPAQPSPAQPSTAQPSPAPEGDLPEGDLPEGERPRWSAPSAKKAKQSKLKKTSTLLGIPSPHSRRAPASGAAGREETTSEWRAPQASLSKRPSARSASFERAAEALESARERDEVGRALTDYLASRCNHAAYFVISKGLLNGRQGRGPGLTDELVRQVYLPVDTPSTLQSVLASRCPYRGAIGEAPPDRIWTSTLGHHPREVVVFPVSVRNRVVGVLYGDGLTSSFDESEAAELLVHAERAYEQVLIARKGSG
jgi:hypothetical protein